MNGVIIVTTDVMIRSHNAKRWGKAQLAPGQREWDEKKLAVNPQVRGPSVKKSICVMYTTFQYAPSDVGKVRRLTMSQYLNSTSGAFGEFDGASQTFSFTV